MNRIRRDRIKEYIEQNKVVTIREIQELFPEVSLMTIHRDLDALEADHDYLTAGGVFPEELLKNWIVSKRAECRQMSAIPHPVEFEKYYNL